jgi:hypothetical protein
MHTLILGGKPFVINEPVFKDLRIILTALNRLNHPDSSDFNLVADVQLILTALIGGDNVRKFRRYSWEAWKIPAPNPEEMTAMLAAIPEICGLQKSSLSNGSTSSESNDWDALYWRIIRQTGWTWETVDTMMTISKLNALSESLNMTPAVESLVAAYLGYEYVKTETLQDKIDAFLASNPNATQH